MDLKHDLYPHCLPNERASRSSLPRPSGCACGREVDGAERDDQPRARLRVARRWFIPYFPHVRNANRNRQDERPDRHFSRAFREARGEQASCSSGRVRDARPSNAWRDDDYVYTCGRRGWDRCPMGARRDTTRRFTRRQNSVLAWRSRNSRRWSRRVELDRLIRDADTRPPILTGSEAPDREVVSFETVYQSIFVLSHVRIA
jgi:hypothetical protein